MAGRTLLQQALPVTFGLKAAGWLVAVVDGRAARRRAAARGPARRRGGHAGRARRRRRRACSPSSPRSSTWPSRCCPGTPRGGASRELAGALAVAAGAVGKIALDIVLLAQTEVGEVAEAAAAAARRRCRTSAIRRRRLARGPARCRAGGGRHGARRDGPGARARGGCLAGRVGAAARGARPDRRRRGGAARVARGPRGRRRAHAREPRRDGRAADGRARAAGARLAGGRRRRPRRCRRRASGPPEATRSATRCWRSR